MVASPLAATVVTAILRCDFCAAKLLMMNGEVNTLKLGDGVGLCFAVKIQWQMLCFQGSEGREWRIGLAIGSAKFGDGNFSMKCKRLNDEAGIDVPREIFIGSEYRVRNQDCKWFWTIIQLCSGANSGPRSKWVFPSTRETIRDSRKAWVVLSKNFEGSGKKLRGVEVAPNVFFQHLSELHC